MATNMKPSWETVEYARTRLMSFWAKPMLAAKIAVKAPTRATTIIVVGLIAKRIFIRPIM